MNQAGSLLDRPRFYYNIDGMAELGGSVMCLGYALLIRYRRLTTIIAGALGALVPVGLVIGSRRHWDITTPASLMGLVFAAAYAYQIARPVRWKWVVVWAMTLGSLVIAFVPADVLGALANDSSAAHPVRAKLAGTILLSLMIYGTMLLVSGGISFWLYLRHTQTPAQEGR